MKGNDPMQFVIRHAERPDFENQSQLEQIAAIARTGSMLLAAAEEYLDENRNYLGGPDEDHDSIVQKGYWLKKMRRDAMEIRELAHLAKWEIRLGKAVIYTQQLASLYTELRDDAWQFCDLECPELIPALEQSL
jgi:hypothetical protein